LNKLQTDAKNENTRLASQGKGWRQVAFERSNQTPSIFSGTSSELKTLLQKGHIKEADLKASGVPMSFVNGGVVTPPKGLSPEEREKLTGTKNGVRQDLPLGEKPAPANHTGRKAESGVKTGTAAFPGKASEAPKGVNTAHKPDRVNNLSPQIMTSQTDVPGSIGEAINETDKELKGPYLNPGEGTGVCEIYSNKIAKKLAEKGVQAEVVKLDDIGRSHAVVVAKTSEGEYLIDRTIGQFVRPDNVITRTGAMYGSAKKRVEDNKTVQDLVNKGVSKLEPGDLQRYKDFMKVEPPPSKSK
jgi:predicted transglutaminase-like cysteine proteinase